MSLSTRHAAEIAAAKDWHAHAPLTKIAYCPRCRNVRTWQKSRWTWRRYACELCGFAIDEPRPPAP